jgi:hypothetical protein
VALNVIERLRTHDIIGRDEISAQEPQTLGPVRLDQSVDGFDELSSVHERASVRDAA